MNREDIAGIILAAGASSRMGHPKALLEYRGETFVARLVRSLGTWCARVVVVLGHDADRVRGAVPAGARIAINPDPERGMLSSLQCGLRAVADAEAVLFLPVDFAAVGEDTIATVAAAAGTAPIVAPMFGEQHGHPVCVSHAIAEELLALPATAQARDVIRSHRATTRFAVVRDAGAVNDIDTPEDYRALVEMTR